MPTPTEAPIVDLGGRQIRLVLPKSWTVRNEIAMLGPYNVHRAAAAALGACWPTEKAKPGQPRHKARQQRQRQQAQEEKGGQKRLRRPAVFYEAVNGNTAVFGQMFLDGIMEQAERVGFTYMEVVAAGMVAYRYIEASVGPSEPALQEVEDDFFDGSGEE